VWLFWCAFNLLLLFIYPTWIAPYSTSSSPLDDAQLRARVEALLARCGFASSGLFVMDGSKRSSHGNAYFTGFGKSKRIVFFDTLLGRLQACRGRSRAGARTRSLQAPPRAQADRHALRVCRCGFLAILGQLIDAELVLQRPRSDEPEHGPGLLLFFLAGPVFAFC
jgi:STE24 endopeptidase